MWPESDIGFERAGRNWLSRGECVPPSFPGSGADEEAIRSISPHAREEL